MRIVAAFAPQHMQPAAAQLLYFVTDVFLLAGLIAIYVRCAGEIGWIGLLGFAAALIGFCAIRTQSLMGVATYPIGGALCLFGMALIGTRIPLDRRLPRIAPLLWMAALVIGVAGTYWPIMAWGVFLSGIVFALGFIAAGVPLMRGPARP